MVHRWLTRNAFSAGSWIFMTEGVGGSCLFLAHSESNRKPYNVPQASR